MWGNIHAVVNRDVLPLRPAIRIAIRYGLSLFTFVGSGVALILTLTGHIHIPQVWFSLFWCSLAIWLLNFALGGWVNAGRREREPDRPSTSGRIASCRRSAAVVLCPFSASFTVIALITTLYMGNPKSFEVIGKTAKTSDLEIYTAEGARRWRSYEDQTSPQGSAGYVIVIGARARHRAHRHVRARPQLQRIGAAEGAFDRLQYVPSFDPIEDATLGLSPNSSNVVRRRPDPRSAPSGSSRPRSSSRGRQGGRVHRHAGAGHAASAGVKVE